ncbi:MAG: replication protein RepA [Sideroxydans sp.]|nr:replication protein RepA [Sideroxydans sp.]
MDSTTFCASSLAVEGIAHAAARTLQSSQAPIDSPEVRAWRENYQRYLIAHTVPANQATEMAAKVAYRPDLYQFDGVLAVASVQHIDRRTVAPKSAGSIRSAKLIEASSIIASTPPCGDDMAFTHSVFCQVGLPRKQVKSREFRRQSNAMWINLQAGVLDEGYGPVEQVIPYGPMPRLALAWVSTLAKRHKTREIPIGNSAAEFLRMMGMDDQGARYTTLRKQMHALAACRLQIGYHGRTFNGQPVEQFDAWMPGKDHRQKALWPGIMVLSECYYRELLEHGVPLDNRALLVLKGSALALDVYTWLAHRLHRIEGRPVTLYWKSLREQFGQEYQGQDADKDFKKSFLPALQAALAVYPKAQTKVKTVRGGLLLMNSPPPISYKTCN